MNLNSLDYIHGSLALHDSISHIVHDLLPYDEVPLMVKHLVASIPQNVLICWAHCGSSLK